MNSPFDSERLFVALTLPEVARSELAELIKPLIGVRWTPRDQLHVTLRFIGDVSTAQESVIREKLATIRVGSFILPIEGIGTFPPGRPPRILWAGIGRGHPRLFQLRQRLDDALLSSGIALDVRTFHPHVTLGRCTEDAAADIGRWQRAHEDFVAAPFRVTSFDVYRSELSADGAQHFLKQRFALAD